MRLVGRGVGWSDNRSKRTGAAARPIQRVLGGGREGELRRGVAPPLVSATTSLSRRSSAVLAEGTRATPTHAHTRAPPRPSPTSPRRPPPGLPHRRRQHVDRPDRPSVPAARAIPHPRAPRHGRPTTDTLLALAAHPPARSPLLPPPRTAYAARLSPASPLARPDTASQRSCVDRVPCDDALGRQGRRQVRPRPARRRARGGRGLRQPPRRRRAPDPDLLGHLRGLRRAGSAQEPRHGARGLRRADRGRVRVALQGREVRPASSPPLHRAAADSSVPTGASFTTRWTRSTASTSSTAPSPPRPSSPSPSRPRRRATAKEGASSPSSATRRPSGTCAPGRTSARSSSRLGERSGSARRTWRRSTRRRWRARRTDIQVVPLVHALSKPAAEPEARARGKARASHS